MKEYPMKQSEGSKRKKVTQGKKDPAYKEAMQGTPATKK